MPTSTPLVLQHLAGNDEVTMVPLQAFLAPHVDTFVALWISAWFITACVVLYQLARAYIQHRKEGR